MKNYKNLISEDPIPAHIAIIMDGNGRWANIRSLPRSEGHKKGAEVIEPLVDTAADMGVKAVSLYAFSVENWLRPKFEIIELWSLLEYFFKHNIQKIKDKNIRVKHTGTLKKLPPSTKKIIKNAVEETEGNNKMVLNFCINYGSRQEIVSSVNDWLDTRKKKEKLTVKKLEKYLFTSDLPDIDLMIRTSGEFRLSNFLLWQLAYTELYFTDVLWPDFTPGDLYEAVYHYQNRDRRFGGI
jgi:undecaprenyl diphosphate synthase